MADAMGDVMPGIERRAARALFQTLDADGDGKVQKSEFVKGLAVHSPALRRRPGSGTDLAAPTFGARTQPEMASPLVTFGRRVGLVYRRGRRIWRCLICVSLSIFVVFWLLVFWLVYFFTSRRAPATYYPHLRR